MRNKWNRSGAGNELSRQNLADLRQASRYGNIMFNTRIIGDPHRRLVDRDR